MPTYIGVHETGKVVAVICVWWRDSGLSPVPALWLLCAALPQLCPSTPLPLSSIPLQASLMGTLSTEEPTTPSFKDDLARVRTSGAALEAQPGKVAPPDSQVTKASGETQHKRNPHFVKQANRKTQKTTGNPSMYSFPLHESHGVCSGNRSLALQPGRGGMETQPGGIRSCAAQRGSHQPHGAVDD